MKKRGQNGFFLLIIVSLLCLLLFTLSSSKRTSLTKGENIITNTVGAIQQTTESARTIAQANTSPTTLKPALSEKQLLEQLQKKYRAQLKVDRNDQQKPVRINTKIKLKKDKSRGIETDEQAMLDLIGDAAPLLDIDHPEQLTNPTNQTGTLGEITNFEQMYEGIPVDGAQVRVHRDGQGNVVVVNSTYIDGVNGVNTTHQVPASEARGLAISHAISLDADYSTNPQNRTPVVNQAPQLVIHKFTQGGVVDLCWKITTVQVWLAGQGHAVGHYFINAHNSSVFERVEGAIN